MVPMLALLMALQKCSCEMLVRQASMMMGVDPDYAVCIVEHESEFDPNAIGDDGAAVGLWQWHLDSWEHVRQAMGLSLDDRRNDPIESTMTALYAIGKLDLGRWWTANRHCGG